MDSLPAIASDFAGVRRTQRRRASARIRAVEIKALAPGGVGRVTPTSGPLLLAAYKTGNIFK